MSLAAVRAVPAGGAVVRVAIVGLGAIGREVFRAARGRAGLEITAVADPAFAGRDPGEVAEVGPAGLTVVADVAEALAGGG